MSAVMESGNYVLSATLKQLHILYRENRKRPGTLLRIGIKPRWNAVIGSRNECGIAINSVDINTLYGTQGEPTIQTLRTFLGKHLFTLAEQGIQSQDPLERSIGIACMSALSQKFLGCTGTRRRGYLSQCWKTGDEFVRDFPTMSHVITPDETVAVVGYESQITPLRTWCRKLHVIHVNPPETLESVLIDNECADLPSAIEYHASGDSERILAAADVVLLSTSTLVDNSFERHMRSAKNARLIGMFGLGSSLIPDAFFERGVDMFSSFRIIDPESFVIAMENDYDMEHSMKTAQKQYLMMRPDVVFRESSKRAIPRHVAIPGGP
ncbi:MAG: DUF364 domain-containing protein [Methanoregula sp.]|nr:DUF364 domain-containing protein [Methanoregula sp.]